MSCLDCPDLNFFLSDDLNATNVGATIGAVSLDPFATANVISNGICPDCLYDDPTAVPAKTKV